MRYKLTIEYDGTGFVGWQIQKSGLSVQGELVRALKALTGADIQVDGAGRTDAGVHALGQVASFDLCKKISLQTLRDGLNAHLRPLPVSVLSAEQADDDFHARFSAKRRHYLYRVVSRRSPIAIMRHYAHQVYLPLDLTAMQKASALLIGKHDFSTFRAAECQAKSPVKTLEKIEIVKDGDVFSFYVSAPSFLHHQVRNIVGTLLFVGTGKWSFAQFDKAFKACDRTQGGPTAPAHGLYFLAADYT